MDKNSKSVTSLFIVLALLALVALAVSVSRQSSTSQDVVIPGLGSQINQVSAARLTGAGDNLIADLRRESDGWVVANAGNYPANVGALRSTLLTLADAKIVENTTAVAENYSRLGVEDVSSANATGIRLELDGLTEPVAVIIGKTSSGNTSFLRRADSAQSWRISGTLEPGRSTLDWLDKTLLDISANEVLSIDIAHADGERVTVNKAMDGYELATKSAGQELRFAGILNSIAGALDDLSFDAVKPASELASDDPARQAEIIVRSVTGLIINIAVQSVGDARWLTFATDFDADLVSPIATENANDEADSETDNAAASLDQVTDASSDAAAAQAELEAKLSGWAYQVPVFKSDWLLKRNADLVSEAES